MNWLREDGTGVVLSLHVQPGAKRTEVVGLHGDALKIRLAAPPVDGRANEALVAFLAATLGTAKANIEIVSGHGARTKRVRIGGIDAADARDRLTARA